MAIENEQQTVSPNSCNQEILNHTKMAPKRHRRAFLRPAFDSETGINYQAGMRPESELLCPFCFRIINESAYRDILQVLKSVGNNVNNLYLAPIMNR